MFIINMINNIIIHNYYNHDKGNYYDERDYYV